MLGDLECAYLYYSSTKKFISPLFFGSSDEVLVYLRSEGRIYKVIVVLVENCENTTKFSSSFEKRKFHSMLFELLHI